LNDRQLTLEESVNVREVKGLTEPQRKIISLVSCGLCQADIARKLQVSRSYVNQVIKRMETHGLIQRVDTHKTQPGKRSYTLFYQLSPELQSRVKGDKMAEPFTACRVHNLRMKVAIISVSDPLSTDKRTGYQHSWKMRGPLRHKYWYSGKAGMPSCTIDYHIKTLVCYVDKKQTIIAKTPKEAEDIGWRAIYQALDQFIELQSKFGIQIDVAHTGTVIGKPHGGFVGTDSPVMDEGVRTKDWWIDRSQEAELGPGHPELETTNKEGMTRLDNLIKVSEQVDLIKLPEIFKDIVNPIAASVLQVQAMMQGSITNQQMLENVTKLISSVLIEMQSIRAENADLKARLG